VKFFCLSLLLLNAFSCASSGTPLAAGECVEEPFGIYTYKILSTSEDGVIKARAVGAPGSAVATFTSKTRLQRVGCP
jgi:hypothetical protein